MVVEHGRVVEHLVGPFDCFSFSITEIFVTFWFGSIVWSTQLFRLFRMQLVFLDENTHVCHFLTIFLKLSAISFYFILRCFLFAVKSLQWLTVFIVKFFRMNWVFYVTYICFGNVLLQLYLHLFEGQQLLSLWLFFCFAFEWTLLFYIFVALLFAYFRQVLLSTDSKQVSV